MPRISVINQREITEDGVIQVRISKRIVDNGEVISSQWHRTSIAPGDDVENTIASVDAHLTQMGYGPVVNWQSVRALVASEHTPEVVAKYQAQMAAQAAERAA